MSQITLTPTELQVLNRFAYERVTRKELHLHDQIRVERAEHQIEVYASSGLLFTVPNDDKKTIDNA